MSTATWTSGLSGDWSLAADWSSGVVPADIGVAALLSGGLAETVGVAASEYFAIGGLSVTDARATLAVAGVLSVAALGNAGTIQLSGGAAALVASGAVTNQGSIGVSGGAALWLDPGSTLTNTGTITLSTGGTLGIDTTLALSALNRVGNAGGTVDVYGGGTLNLAGAVAVCGTAGLLSVLALDGGTLSKGTLDNAGGQIGLYGTLNAITWEGPLAIGAGQTVTVVGGLRVITAAAAPGTITLAGGRLAIGDSETLDHMTLLAAPPAGSNDFIDNAALADGAPSGTLTFGGGFVLSQSGGTTWLQDFSGGNGVSTAVNNGQMLISGGTLVLQEGVFNNAGTLAIAGGAMVEMLSFTTISDTGLIEATGGSAQLAVIHGAVSTGFTNLAGGVYSGGTLAAVNGGTLNVSAGGQMTTDNATLSLSGAGAAIRFLNPASGGYANIITTLTTLNGVLSLSNGASFATTVALTDNNLVALNGGTLSVKGLTIGAAGTVGGSGMMVAQNGVTLVNNGLIAASGSLDINGAVSGSGRMTIAAGATLELTRAETNPIAFLGAGLLRIDTEPFTGAITGLVAGDTLFLVGAVESSATLSGGTLTLNQPHRTPRSFTASGAPGLVAQVAQDGQGNSIVTFSNPAAALAAHLLTPPAPTLNIAAATHPAGALAHWSGGPTPSPDTTPGLVLPLAQHQGGL